MANRPTFLSIIAILLVFIGFCALVLGLLLFVMKADIEKALDDMGFIAGDLISILGAISLIMGLLTLVVGILLWKGIKIGWYLALIMLILWIIEGILMFPLGIVGLVIAILLLWYFFRPNVRAFFGT